MGTKVLVVEDDQQIAQLVEIHLSDLGFSVDIATNGQTGLEKALSDDYQLIILDIMLPQLDGLTVCRKLREKRKKVPILMLTAKSEEMDKILGLEIGADDYVTKPFSIGEFVARIKALLRRFEEIQGENGAGEATPELVFGELVIDLEKHKASLGGKNVSLTSKEFTLLSFLACNPGRPFNRKQLLDRVWAYDYEGYEHTVNSHINRLRSKIEDDPSNPKYILTVWGVGYRFVEKDELGK